MFYSIRNGHEFRHRLSIFIHSFHIGIRVQLIRYSIHTLRSFSGANSISIWNIFTFNHVNYNKKDILKVSEFLSLQVFIFMSNYGKIKWNSGIISTKRGFLVLWSLTFYFKDQNRIFYDVTKWIQNIDSLKWKFFCKFSIFRTYLFKNLFSYIILSYLCWHNSWWVKKDYLKIFRRNFFGEKCCFVERDKWCKKFGVACLVIFRERLDKIPFKTCVNL